MEKAKAEQIIRDLAGTMPDAKFRIVENVFQNGRGEICTEYDVYEVRICRRCGTERLTRAWGEIDNGLCKTCVEAAEKEYQAKRIAEREAEKTARWAARDRWEER